jgi:hypothetical protein
MEACDGHRQAGSEIVAIAGRRQDAGRGGSEGGHGREDGTQVSAAGEVTQRGGPAARLAHAAEPVRRGLVGGVCVAGGPTWIAGEDGPPGAAAPLPGPICRRAVANIAAAGALLAGIARAGQGSVLRPGARAGSTGGIGLHADGEPGRDARGAAVRSPGLPLRADLLELGDDDDLFLGEFREPQCGLAERVVGTERRAGASPDRPAEHGGEQLDGAKGVHATVPGIAGSLWVAGREDPG